jgi:predicted transcriptional regulator
VRSVLISIQPKWCELIASGKKTVEVRKSKPKLDTPFKVYIYCTKGQHETLWRYFGKYYYDTQFPNERPNRASGKVIGEFVCNEITVAEYGSYYVLPKSKTMLDELDLLEYADGKTVYGWHISDLVIYDKPKELSEFKSAVTYGRKLRTEFFGKDPCCVNDYRLTRPPQSWCYVEELG